MGLEPGSQAEQRNQRELDRGLQTEHSWSDEEKAELNDRLDRSLPAIHRGEGIPGDKVRELLAHRLAFRAR